MRYSCKFHPLQTAERTMQSNWESTGAQLVLNPPGLKKMASNRSPETSPLEDCRPACQPENRDWSANWYSIGTYCILFQSGNQQVFNGYCKSRALFLEKCEEIDVADAL